LVNSHWALSQIRKGYIRTPRAGRDASQR